MLAAVAIVLVAFVARLVQLQAFDSASYAAAAERQRLRTIALPAPRGSITDRNGVPFAASVSARAVYADPRVISDAADAAARLAPLLGAPPEELTAKLAKPRAFVYLARGVSPQRARDVMALRLPGVGTHAEQRRVYPSGGVAANVVGFVGADGHGRAGLESSRDELLAGVDGRRTLEVGRNGPAIPVGVEAEHAAVPGRGLVLTLDRDLQWVAESAIAARVKAASAQSGTVVVLDPRSGEVLAMATAPSFDPNDPGKAGSSAGRNRVVEDVYEPGSTNKVITAAAALELGVAKPDTPYAVPGTLRLAGKTFHDAHPHGLEHLTFAGVLAKSSNIGAIRISQQVGKERLYDFLRAFGFGDKTGVGLPGETRGILSPPQKWSKTQQYTIAFGQGVSVNALQMASVFATIANDGVRAGPTLVRATVATDGRLSAAPPPPRRRVVRPETAGALRAILEAVTGDEGTAPKAAIRGYRIAGKTGTSQRVDPACACYRGYTASFMGFAPADRPELVVAVIVQDPKRGHLGGAVAAPVFRDVMAFALGQRKVPPTGTKPPPLRLETSPTG